MAEYSTWDYLFYEYGGMIGRRVVYEGKEYKFFGLVCGEDDLYYGLCDGPSGSFCLLSCVGSLQGQSGFGVTLVEGEWPERLGWKEWVAAGGPRIPDNWQERHRPQEDEDE